MAEKYISKVDTAKLVRAELKKHFPKIQFSVTCSRGSSIDVHWKDGPTTKQVEKVAGHFHGGEFDGMQDLLYFNDRPYMNHFIFFNRDCSDKWYDYQMKKLIREYGLNPLLLATPDKWDESLKKAGDSPSLRNAAWRELAKEDLTGREPPESPSIIKDWSKVRDWELAELVKKGYPDAEAEHKRRQEEAAAQLVEKRQEELKPHSVHHEQRRAEIKASRHKRGHQRPFDRSVSRLRR